MMTQEQMMAVFEKANATWAHEFDFSKDDSGPNGLIYSSYETGITFGTFLQGWDAAIEHFGVKE